MALYTKHRTVPIAQTALFRRLVAFATVSGESLETFTATKSVQLDRCVDLSVVAARIDHLV